MELNTFCETYMSQAELAAAMPCSQVTIHHWCTKKKPIPVARCVQLERATKQKVRRWDMRDDWYDHWPELVGTKGAPDLPAAQ